MSVLTRSANFKVLSTLFSHCTSDPLPLYIFYFLGDLLFTSEMRSGGRTFFGIYLPNPSKILFPLADTLLYILSNSLFVLCAEVFAFVAIFPDTLRPALNRGLLFCLNRLSFILDVWRAFK